MKDSTINLVATFTLALFLTRIFVFQISYNSHKAWIHHYSTPVTNTRTWSMSWTPRAVCSMVRASGKVTKNHLKRLNGWSSAAKEPRICLLPTRSLCTTKETCRPWRRTQFLRNQEFLIKETQLKLVGDLPNSPASEDAPSLSSPSTITTVWVDVLSPPPPYLCVLFE